MIDLVRLKLNEVKMFYGHPKCDINFTQTSIDDEPEALHVPDDDDSEMPWRLIDENTATTNNKGSFDFCLNPLILFRE